LSEKACCGKKCIYLFWPQLEEEGYTKKAIEELIIKMHEVLGDPLKVKHLINLYWKNGTSKSRNESLRRPVTTDDHFGLDISLFTSGRDSSPFPYETIL
jgi:hypothetical protein